MSCIGCMYMYCNSTNQPTMNQPVMNFARLSQVVASCPSQALPMGCSHSAPRHSGHLESSFTTVGRPGLDSAAHQLSDEELARQLEGLCAHCDRRKARPGHELCSVCYAAYVARTSATCSLCGVMPPNVGYRWCQECYENYLINQASQQHPPAPPTPQRHRVQDSHPSSMLSSLPSRTFLGAADVLQGNDAECTICCIEYEQGDEICLLPACMHAFHPSCIQSWLQNKATCPVCMRDVLEDLQVLQANFGDLPGDELDLSSEDELDLTSA